MDLVHSRGVRELLVAIILSILKCVFYSRSISSADVLTPPLTILYNQTARQEVNAHNTSLLTIAGLLASIIYIHKTTLRKATFSSLCEVTMMRLSLLLEQLVRLPDMGFYGGMAPSVSATDFFRDN